VGNGRTLENRAGNRWASHKTEQTGRKSIGWAGNCAAHEKLNGWESLRTAKSAATENLALRSKRKSVARCTNRILDPAQGKASSGEREPAGIKARTKKISSKNESYRQWNQENQIYSRELRGAVTHEDELVVLPWTGGSRIEEQKPTQESLAAWLEQQQKSVKNPCATGTQNRLRGPENEWQKERPCRRGSPGTEKRGGRTGRPKEEDRACEAKAKIEEQRGTQI
jgi:hypothetical protein